MWILLSYLLLAITAYHLWIIIILSWSCFIYIFHHLFDYVCVSFFHWFSFSFSFFLIIIFLLVNFYWLIFIVYVYLIHPFFYMIILFTGLWSIIFVRLKKKGSFSPSFYFLFLNFDLVYFIVFKLVSQIMFRWMTIEGMSRNRMTYFIKSLFGNNLKGGSEMAIEGHLI